MKNCREQWYDADKRVVVNIVDVTDAAQALARGHLSGPTSSYILAKALSAVALLGNEMSEENEVVSLQMKCDGPLGGFFVECSKDGKLRGYTEKKILDAFDGMGIPNLKMLLGSRHLQVTRSIPGKIISQGVSNSLDGYLAGSLQRKARIFVEASVTDDVEILEARGLMVEAMPDSEWSVFEGTKAFDKNVTLKSGFLARSSRTLLNDLGLSRAELRSTTPLSFGCRCSPERATNMLAALSKEDRENLPNELDITCHMCGKIYTVRTK